MFVFKRTKKAHVKMCVTEFVRETNTHDLRDNKNKLHNVNGLIVAPMHQPFMLKQDMLPPL